MQSSGAGLNSIIGLATQQHERVRQLRITMCTTASFRVQSRRRNLWLLSSIGLLCFYARHANKALHRPQLGPDL